jgi:lipopolysaccharide/colanic/teichoic acid biosynthesis glycosyltransferase
MMRRGVSALCGGVVSGGAADERRIQELCRAFGGRVGDLCALGTRWGLLGGGLFNPRLCLVDERREYFFMGDPAALTSHPPVTRPGRPGGGAASSIGRANGYMVVKTGLEWAGALVLLLLFTPLLACLTVLLRRTSAGPAIYTQLRLGRGGKPFWIYKLRTMTHGCETATGPVWSITDDPRVTRVGQWLRDTHLDELPQLWNVLKGDMSLIGPRPERPELASKIERWLPEFRERLAVRPGITGLAQVRMPADSDLHTVRQKLANDLKYIERIGPTLDARVALATVLHFLGQAALQASLRLVRSYAPAQLTDVAPELPRLDLTLNGHVAGRLHIVPDEDDLPQAA